MSSNMERVAAMPDASLYVNRDGRCADDCVDSHGGGNLTKIPRSGGDSQKTVVKYLAGRHQRRPAARWLLHLRRKRSSNAKLQPHRNEIRTSEMHSMRIPA
jgi:hypothetical protein